MSDIKMMVLEEIKETIENLKTGVFDRTTGTKELFLPMFESLITTIESQQEKLDLLTEPASEIIEFLTEGIAQKDALIESQKEEIEKMRYCLNSIANRQIGVFGEGFGYDFHYKNLRESAKKCLDSLYTVQEGNK